LPGREREAAEHGNCPGDQDQHELATPKSARALSAKIRCRSSSVTSNASTAASEFWM
jgi:hypothetical protein